MLHKPQTLGPNALPMLDVQAKSLESRLKSIPKDDAFAYRRLAAPRSVDDLQTKKRFDISWISEQSPDRAGDVVLASGMDDSHFKLNPIVTLNHAYDQPPVGRSLWRYQVTDGQLTGIKAKTYYPPRPADWTNTDWPPDIAFALVQAGLLVGKSIGFFPLKLHQPSADEIRANVQLKNVRFIIEEWLLAEYACCYLPMQPNAVVEQVVQSKSATTNINSSCTYAHIRPIAFTPITEIDRALARLFASQKI